LQQRSSRGLEEPGRVFWESAVDNSGDWAQSSAHEQESYSNVYPASWFGNGLVRTRARG